MRSYFRKYFICLITALFLSSCDGVFVPDPIDPRLPRYTEEGHNSAGALIDGGIWRSMASYGLHHYHLGPIIKSDTSKQVVSISFNGEMNENRINVIFHLGDLHLSSFNSLIELEGQTFIFDGIDIYGALNRKHDNLQPNGSTGQLFFRRVAPQDSTNSFVMSGTFGFTIPNSSGSPRTIYHGRFDYDVDEVNDFFFK